jgi:hypothetical protein
MKFVSVAALLLALSPLAGAEQIPTKEICGEIVPIKCITAPCPNFEDDAHSPFTLEPVSQHAKEYLAAALAGTAPTSVCVWYQVKSGNTISAEDIGARYTNKN